MAPFSFVHPVIHSTRPYRLSFVNNFRTMSHPFHLLASLSPKFIPVKATFWQMFRLILSLSQQGISQGFLVTFSLKTWSLSLGFHFGLKTVSFLVPTYQHTQKMSHIIPSPDCLLSTSLDVNLSPRVSSLLRSCFSWIFFFWQSHLIHGVWFHIGFHLISAMDISLPPQLSPTPLISDSQL